MGIIELALTNEVTMIKRREKILISALELFEEGGINNITTKNLAKKEGISEPALYRQYKNKFEIIKALVDEYASFDERIINTIKEGNLSGYEAIIFYVTRFGELYQNYSELSLIIASMDLYYYDEETRLTMYNTLKVRQDAIEEYLETHPLESPRLKNKTIGKLVNDLINSEVFRWQMNGKSYDLVEAMLMYVKEILG